MLVNGGMEDVRLVAFSDENLERAANWSTVFSIGNFDEIVKHGYV